MFSAMFNPQEHAADGQSTNKPHPEGQSCQVRGKADAEPNSGHQSPAVFNFLHMFILTQIWKYVDTNVTKLWQGSSKQVKTCKPTSELLSDLAELAVDDECCDTCPVKNVDKAQQSEIKRLQQIKDSSITCIFSCNDCTKKFDVVEDFMWHITDVHTQKCPALSFFDNSLASDANCSAGKRFERIKSWSDLSDYDMDPADVGISKDAALLDYWVHNVYDPGYVFWMAGYDQVQARSSQDAKDPWKAANADVHEMRLRILRAFVASRRESAEDAEDKLKDSGILVEEEPKAEEPDVEPLVSFVHCSTNLCAMPVSVVHPTGGIAMCAPDVGKAAPYTPSSSSTGNNSSQGSKRVRPGAGSSSDGAGGKKPRTGNATHDRKGKGETGLKLACPYWKLNPIRHGKCAQTSFANVSLVRNHLLICHWHEYFCTICFNHFADCERLCEHVRTATNQPATCVTRLAEDAGIFDTSVYQKLKDKKNHIDHIRNEYPEEEDQWYFFWDIVFPNHTDSRPSSPYHDDTWRSQIAGQVRNDMLEQVLQSVYNRLTASIDAGPRNPGEQVHDLHRMLDDIRQDMGSLISNGAPLGRGSQPESRLTLNVPAVQITDVDLDEDSVLGTGDRMPAPNSQGHAETASQSEWYNTDDGTSSAHSYPTEPVFGNYNFNSPNEAVYANFPAQALQQPSFNGLNPTQHVGGLGQNPSQYPFFGEVSDWSAMTQQANRQGRQHGRYVRGPNGMTFWRPPLGQQ